MKGYIINPVSRSGGGSNVKRKRKKNGQFVKSKRRKAPAKRRRANPKRRRAAPKRRRRAPARRRSYSYRRRRAPRRKKNPVGDVMIALLVAGGAAAVAAVANRLILEKPNEEARKAGKAEAEWPIPAGLESGGGRAAVNVGLGVALALALDKLGKGAVKRIAPAVGAGFAAYGVAYYVHALMLEAEKKKAAAPTLPPAQGLVQVGGLVAQSRALGTGHGGNAMQAAYPMYAYAS